MKFCVACWWLALAVFAGLGVLRWSQYFIGAPPRFDDPDIALNQMAQNRFGLDRDGAATLRRELAAFPPQSPLLIFGRGEDWTLSESHFLLSYLAWPRPVWRVVTGGKGSGYVESPPPPGIQPAGFFFYKMDPPTGLPGRPLSPRLTLSLPPP